MWKLLKFSVMFSNKKINIKLFKRDMLIDTQFTTSNTIPMITKKFWSSYIVHETLNTHLTMQKNTVEKAKNTRSTVAFFQHVKQGKQKLAVIFTCGKYKSRVFRVLWVHPSTYRRIVQPRLKQNSDMLYIMYNACVSYSAPFLPPFSLLATSPSLSVRGGLP